MASRWRREDYDKVRHDKCFSDWKVLVGPSDWQASSERASDGGGERFRSRNLPGVQVGSGVYELGVTLPAWKTVAVEQQSDSASLKSEDIVVVYVGHAEHMRKRLQRYSQAGAHLETPRSPISPPLSSRFPELSFAHLEDSGEEHLCKYNQTDRPPLSSSSSSGGGGGRHESKVDLQARIPPVAEPVEAQVRARSGSPRGPRLFSEVFALGCSIAYRWASTRSKEVAEYVVQDLTEAFDYAWNRGANSHVRSQDVLGKIVLGKRPPDTSCCTRTASRWRTFPFPQNPLVGIRIAAHKPKPRRPSQGSRFLMLLRRSSHLLIIKPGGRPGGNPGGKHSAFTKINIPVERCGTVLDSGLVCNALPQKGHKRCPTHMLQVRKTSHVDVDSRRMSCFGCVKKVKVKEPKRKGSVSFSTWLTRSMEFKNKSIEWLLAMEEIKGRSYGNNNCSTSPILKPEIFSLEALEAKFSLSNLNTEQQEPSPLPEQEIGFYPKVDHGMPYSIVSKGSPVRWRERETYATRYITPRYFQG